MFKMNWTDSYEFKQTYCILHFFIMIWSFFEYWLKLQQRRRSKFNMLKLSKCLRSRPFETIRLGLQLMTIFMICTHTYYTLITLLIQCLVCKHQIIVQTDWKFQGNIFKQEQVLVPCPNITDVWLTLERFYICQDSAFRVCIFRNLCVITVVMFKWLP